MSDNNHPQPSAQVFFLTAPSEIREYPATATAILEIPTDPLEAGLYYRRLAEQCFAAAGCSDREIDRLLAIGRTRP